MIARDYSISWLGSRHYTLQATGTDMLVFLARRARGVRPEAGGTSKPLGQSRGDEKYRIWYFENTTQSSESTRRLSN